MSVEQRFCLRLVDACLTFTQGPCYERVFALKKRKNDFQYFDAHNKMSTDWMWCCVSRKATRTLLLLVLLRFFKKKEITLHFGTYNITEVTLLLLCYNINENAQGWKCLMASTEILEAIDPASHLSTFKRSRIFCFAT